MNENIKEKILVIVTGGSRGIGASIVKAFSDSRYHVLFLYKKSHSEANELKRYINNNGGNCTSLKVDITNAEDIRKAKDLITSTYGAPAILVSNAGITNDSLMMNMKYEQWESVIETNMSGAFRFIKEFSGTMMLNGGSVIVISSVAGLIGVEGQTNYCASKFGLIGLTKSLAKELGRFNIRVNAICPGYIETDMLDEKINLTKRDIIKKIPLKRFGKPSEVASVVRFLAGEGSQYISGSVISIDGGLTA